MFSFPSTDHSLPLVLPHTVASPRSPDISQYPLRELQYLLWRTVQPVFSPLLSQKEERYRCSFLLRCKCSGLCSSKVCDQSHKLLERIESHEKLRMYLQWYFLRLESLSLPPFSLSLSTNFLSLFFSFSLFSRPMHPFIHKAWFWSLALIFITHEAGNNWKEKFQVQLVISNYLKY